LILRFFDNALGKDLEGGCLGLFKGFILAVERLKKTLKISVGIASNTDEILSIF
jgi:hypothetical protein